MYTTRLLAAIMCCVIAAPVLAQSSSALNLQLPAPSTMPQTSDESVSKPDPEPSVTPYAMSGDTSSSTPYETTYGDRRDAAEDGCDDETYRKAQVHGSAGVGVAASRHASANYETADLNVSKPLGSCDDPRGNVGASIRVTRSNVDFGHRRGP